MNMFDIRKKTTEVDIALEINNSDASKGKVDDSKYDTRTLASEIGIDVATLNEQDTIDS